MNSNFNNRVDKAMTTEQFTKIIDAILSGKYSWACVLVLRFAGYNPLHYIPYRTYNRLMKENAPPKKRQSQISDENGEQFSDNMVVPMRSPNRSLDDLNYLESLDSHTSRLRGGNSHIDTPVRLWPWN